ncbi:MAG: hypothetical protein ACOYBY_05910 [Dermatophilaceae bacterium]
MTALFPTTRVSYPPAAPDLDEDPLVVEPPEPRPGSWAGAPSACQVDATIYLAYRLRRPVGQGRGFANVVARSDDGERFETLAVVTKDAFDTDSLERPALVRTPAGRWRIYVSVATPGTKHWRVDLLEAASVVALPSATPRTVLPGTVDEAVKDPVVLWYAGQWHLWASVHPLGDPLATDRMTTRHATSPDGLSWRWVGTAVQGRPGAWDARGARVSAVVADPVPWAYYDGRASASENWEERTGVAVSDGRFGAFVASGSAPWAASRHPGGGLRYVSVLDLTDGRRRLYYEVTRSDGAHELRTHLLGPHDPREASDRRTALGG